MPPPCRLLVAAEYVPVLYGPPRERYFSAVVAAKAKAKTAKVSEASVGDLQAILRNAGLRSTAPRIAVLRFLTDLGTPVSHAELFEALASEGFDRATLYRNLVDLAESGLVARTDLGDHVWRFELKRARAGGHVVEHPHFVCTDCGVVSCLPGVAVRITASEQAPRAVTSQRVAVQLTGRCNACT